MNILKQTIPALDPARYWEPTEQMHEFLYGKWVMKGFSHDMRLDWHLPTQMLYDEAAIHQALYDFIVADAKDVDLSELPTPVLKTPSDKWKAFSSLQKGIRRNNPLVTWRACHALLESGGGQGMWRRLSVTVQEDIGLADPYIGAFVALAATNKKLRDHVGEKRLLWWIIQHMCAANKSRDLCDVVVYWFHCDRNWIDDMFEAANNCSASELLEVATNPHASFGDRMTCHFKAWGGKFHHVSKHGNPPVAKGMADDFYEAINLPHLLRYYVKQNYRASTEALGIPVPFMYQWMMTCQHAWEDDDPFEEGDERMINGMYSATFDKHVYQGKAAIGSFIKQCHPIRKWLKDHLVGEEYHVAAVERAIFYTEGAILRPRMFFGNKDSHPPKDIAREFYNDILRQKMRANGIGSLDEGYEFYTFVQSKLDLLHILRGGK